MPTTYRLYWKGRRGESLKIFQAHTKGEGQDWEEGPLGLRLYLGHLEMFSGFDTEKTTWFVTLLSGVQNKSRWKSLLQMGWHGLTLGSV